MEEIQTQRLTLRPFAAGDAEDLYEYLSDEEVVRFEPYRPFTREMCAEEAARRAANPSFIAVTLQGKVIGNIWLDRGSMATYEVGWVFHRGYQGKGYATEAARAAVDWAFKAQGAHRVIAKADPRNAPSWRLCERLGMRREALYRKNVYFFKDEQGNPLWKDTYLYAILDEEWKQTV